MGILFTTHMGFLFTITLGIQFTIVLGIQFTISNSKSRIQKRLRNSFRGAKLLARRKLFSGHQWMWEDNCSKSHPLGLGTLLSRSLHSSARIDKD